MLLNVAVNIFPKCSDFLMLLVKFFVVVENILRISCPHLPCASNSEYMSNC